LQVEIVLHDVLSEVLTAVPLHAPPRALCLGMAGVDRPDDAAIVGRILRRLCRGTETLVVNDALVALEAGAPGAPGVVLIAGTGSIAYGRDAHGRAARAGGWGHLLADEGSGFWLGKEAIRAVLRANDHRDVPTAMRDAILAHFHVTRPSALIHPVYDGGIDPHEIAGVAPLVGRAAAEGDAVARALIATGADELAGAAISVARRLNLAGAPFALPLAGGIFRSIPEMRAAVIERLATHAPAAVPRVLEVEPATGAVRLAAAVARCDARVPVYIETP
jgi:N-acetylglucosamine kinase-like BadF-type ATPase